jgi:hypothetical protein
MLLSNEKRYWLNHSHNCRIIHKSFHNYFQTFCIVKCISVKNCIELLLNGRYEGGNVERFQVVLFSDVVRKAELSDVYEFAFVQ